MKTVTLTKIASAVGMLCLVCNVNALNILDYSIGHATPSTPSGDELEEQRLEYFIDSHNGLTPAAPDGNTYTLDFGSAVFPPMPPLPNWDNTATANINVNALSLTIDVTGWSYLLIKGPGPQGAYYLYVGDLTGEQLFENAPYANVQGKPQEISHYRLFGAEDIPSVPDSGTTVMLMGAGMAALGFARRLIKA